MAMSITVGVDRMHCGMGFLSLHWGESALFPVFKKNEMAVWCILRCCYLNSLPSLNAHYTNKFIMLLVMASSGAAARSANVRAVRVCLSGAPVTTRVYSLSLG